MEEESRPCHHFFRGLCGASRKWRRKADPLEMDVMKEEDDNLVSCKASYWIATHMKSIGVLLESWVYPGHQHRMQRRLNRIYSMARGFHQLCPLQK